MHIGERYNHALRHPRVFSIMQPHNTIRRQRRSHNFFWGGGHPVHFPSSLREPTAFSGGEGVVAEMLRDLNHRISFSGGGGGSGRIFP